jgi:hypothetical protein
MRALALAMLLAACSSKQAADHPAEHMEGHDEHGAMSPEVAKFHDVLSPRWHAAKGPQRMKDTCGAVAEFRTDADAIAKAKPAGDPAAWTTRTQDLTDAVSALDATCQSNDATAFELAFEKVHTSFHAVMEAK